MNQRWKRCSKICEKYENMRVTEIKVWGEKNEAGKKC